MNFKEILILKKHFLWNIIYFNIPMENSPCETSKYSWNINRVFLKNMLLICIEYFTNFNVIFRKFEKSIPEIRFEYSRKKCRKYSINLNGIFSRFRRLKIAFSPNFLIQFFVLLFLSSFVELRKMNRIVRYDSIS